MRRTRLSTLVFLALSVGVVTWVALDLILRHQGWVPGMTPWVALVAVVVSVGVLLAGLGVRRLRAHQPTWITPTAAAATAAAAQASAVVGAVMGGAYGGQLVLALTAQRNGASPAMTDLAWSAGAGVVACLVWTGVGLLVEHWCAIGSDSEDDDPHHEGHGQPGPAQGAAARSGGSQRR